MATDTVQLQNINDRTAKDYKGHTCVQFFYGLTSRFNYIILMDKEHHGPSALQDLIRYVGAP